MPISATDTLRKIQPRPKSLRRLIGEMRLERISLPPDYRFNWDYLPPGCVYPSQQLVTWQKDYSHTVYPPEITR
jgi:hypothetical protein